MNSFIHLCKLQAGPMWTKNCLYNIEVKHNIHNYSVTLILALFILFFLPVSIQNLRMKFLLIFWYEDQGRNLLSRIHFDPFQLYLSAMLSSARPQARVTQNKHTPAVDMAAWLLADCEILLCVCEKSVCGLLFLFIVHQTHSSFKHIIEMFELASASEYGNSGFVLNVHL